MSNFLLPRPAPKPRRVRSRTVTNFSDSAKWERGRSECVFGNALSAQIYDPLQIVPQSGAWAMIKRSLPPLERDMDKQYSVGRVFWIEHDPSAVNEEGFRSDGTYKVWARSVFGDVALLPYEYVVLDTEWIIKAWGEGALTFHPSDMSVAQLTDQVFYCRARGISLADAVVLCLGSITGPVGWFDAEPEIAEFVAEFQDVGILTNENRKRRADAKRKRRKDKKAEVQS